jgi:glycerol uptake facilitator-like aquaporin
MQMSRWRSPQGAVLPVAEVKPQLARRLLAEFLGSTLLTAAVVGSGIAAQRLSPGNVGLELFENAAATAAGLYAVLLVFGPVSGAHLNPVVSLVDAVLGGLSWRDVAAYVPAQIGGCCSGAVLANLMFSRAPVTISSHHRTSGGHLLAETVATAGLILVAFTLARSGRSERTPGAIAAYIGAAYFFTSSTSFANPAITIGRMLSDSFAGIAPSSVPLFILAEVIGGLIGLLLLRVLYPSFGVAAARSVMLPHVDYPATEEVL